MIIASGNKEKRGRGTKRKKIKEPRKLDRNRQGETCYMRCLVLRVGESDSGVL